MITYTNLLDLYTSLREQNINVSSFNSDNNTMFFKLMSNSEVLAISKTLKALGFDNQIILVDNMSFYIKF